MFRYVIAILFLAGLSVQAQDATYGVDFSVVIHDRLCPKEHYRNMDLRTGEKTVKHIPTLRPKHPSIPSGLIPQIILGYCSINASYIGLKHSLSPNLISLFEQTIPSQT
jgi:hypothetical protein